MAAPSRPISQILQDFESGPLDAYRKAASFPWKALKLHLDGEERLIFQDEIWESLRSDPLFDRPLLTASLPEQRQITFARVKRVKELNLLPDGWLSPQRWRIETFIEALDVYDLQLSARMNLHDGVFVNTLRTLGSSTHAHLVSEADAFRIFGCFALSELSHASNTKAMRTEAHYETATKTFRFHTPDIEAAKVWSGNLGESATHAVVWAQLYTPGREGGEICQGLHPFVVQVRDTATLRPLSGLQIGDMGEKVGWNGVDNGWLIFRNFHAPREALLNRNGDVAEDGSYSSPHRSSRGRLGANLGALSSGRVGIAKQASTALRMAVPIAIRYSGARRQFGASEEAAEEWPVLEFPLQQQRLFPLLCQAFLYTQLTRRQLANYEAYVMRMIGGERGREMAEAGREIHALSCAAKPMVSWAAMRAIQECREACGGHGYLKSGRLGDMRADQDPSQTYEGDNNVLLQQTSNYLLAVAKEAEMRGRDKAGPLGLSDFLFLNPPPLRTRGIHPAHITESVIEAYTWLLKHLLNSAKQRLEEAEDQSRARNAAQPFVLNRLSKACLEWMALRWWVEYVAEAPSNLRPVLGALGDLFGVWSLEKHLGILYAAGYAEGGALGQSVEAAMEELCSRLKPDAMALADALAYPDWALNSRLGASDGRIYENIFSAMTQSPGAQSRAHYWQDIVAVTKHAKL